MKTPNLSVEYLVFLVRWLRECLPLQQLCGEAADAIEGLAAELQAYRKGGVTEEILRRNDGYIKVGRGCMIVPLESVTLPPPGMHHLRSETAADRPSVRIWDWALEKDVALTSCLQDLVSLLCDQPEVPTKHKNTLLNAMARYTQCCAQLVAGEPPGRTKEVQ